MTTSGGIAVVVVAHYSGELLLACCRRVLAAEGVEALVVVDNASADGSIEALQALAEPHLRVLRNADNPGFARACNQGAAASDAPWLAFLNPDCLVESDTFARLRRHASAAPGIGLLGADVRDSGGHHEPAARRREPGVLRGLAHAFGLRGRGGLHLQPPDGAAVLTPVDAVSGALMFLSRATFEQLGGFDEAYRLHCEDLDLCHRVRDLGLAVRVAEDVRVAHAKGSSSRRRPLFVAFHKHRGMARYLRKFQGSALAWPRTLLLQAGIWTRFALQLPLLLLRESAARRRERAPQ